MDEQLRRHDQRGFFQHLKSMEFNKVESQCIREEDRRLLRNDDIIVHKRWARFVHSLLNEKTEKLDAGITFKLPQQTTMAKLGVAI